MKTEFKDYLQKKHAQQIIDGIGQKYADKKIILYGAGLFAGELMRNYDFSKLNIIGVADRKFQEHREGDFYGYKKLGPLDLLETEFDLLLISTYDDTDIKDYLKNDLLQGEEINFKIKTLVRMNVLEYVHGMLEGDF